MAKQLSFIGNAVLAMAACSILIVHVAACMLYNSPPNAIKIENQARLDSYIFPFFYQNWSFFAPNPIDRDYSLIAQATYTDGKQSDWYDVTDAFVRALRANRFSESELILAGISNSVISLQQNPLLRKRKPSAVDVMADGQLRLLYRLSASWLLQDHSGRSYRSLRVGFRISEFPRFTHRADHDQRHMKTYLRLFPSVPFPADVSPIFS